MSFRRKQAADQTSIPPHLLPLYNTAQHPEPETHTSCPPTPPPAGRPERYNCSVTVTKMIGLSITPHKRAAWPADGDTALGKGGENTQGYAEIQTLVHLACGREQQQFGGVYSISQ